MEEPTGMSREQFFTAVQRGDARTVAALFEQRASAETVAVVDPQECRAGADWLRPFAVSTRCVDTHSLLAMAIRFHSVDVLAWLFSAEAIATVGREPLAMALEAACHLAMRSPSLAVLELLLESPVCTQLPDPTRQALLDRMLCLVRDGDISGAVRLLAAHGACVNALGADRVSPVLMLQAVRRPDLTLFHAIVRDGAITIGARALEDLFSGQREPLARLFGYGLLPIHAGWLLHRAVSLGGLDTARFWLDYSHVDVDVRVLARLTPLMHVAHEASHCRLDQCKRAEVTKLLLEYGANVSATDAYGKTPLRHAIGCCDAQIVRLLLEHGADANQPTDRNGVVLDFLDLRLLHQPRIAAQLEYLLQYGANPLLPNQEGVSALDRLR